MRGLQLKEIFRYISEDNFFYFQKAYRKHKPGIQEIYSFFTLHKLLIYQQSSMITIFYASYMVIYVLFT